MFLSGLKRKFKMCKFLGLLVNCAYVLILFNMLTIYLISKSEARVHTPPKHMLQMDRDLDKIPTGSTDIEVLNVAYNTIEELPDFVFWNNSFVNTKKLILSENCIHTIQLNAFKGLKQVKIVDLSANNISALDPYTFKSNHKLQRLILYENQISFNRVQTFLVSPSIEALILSKNKITDVYDTTFLGLPNLKELVLNDNDLKTIGPHSFMQLSQLRYLSLANTGVHRLGESMFAQIPKLLNLEGTPLSERFEPPLKQVREDAVRTLLSLNRQFGS